jgi:deoxyribodipyrimidine photo-lyase
MSGFMFSASREAGLLRLAAFAPKMGKHYAAHRNRDVGPGQRDEVSMLSPYLRFRMITEEEVLAVALSRFSFGAAEKFIQEVFWRGYFKGYLEHQPGIWRNYLRAIDSIPRSKAYLEAIEGRTGIDCFDFWVQELKETGYLHNHARMWFASIWIFTLRLPWELGADFMYRHLIDGDPASNTLSWRWVGGLHTKGKTYMARADNIAHYTDGRFHPKGLVVVAAPLTEPPLPPPVPLSSTLSALPDGHFGLLVTAEDLQIESLPVTAAPASVAMALQPIPKPGEVESGVSLQFRADALLEARQRLSAHFEREIKLLDALAPEDVLQWCRVHTLSTVATAFAATGPEADCLAAIEDHLRKHGITLIRVRRRYDTAVWPHATKGFFALKEKLPTILQKLNPSGAQAELF